MYLESAIYTVSPLDEPITTHHYTHVHAEQLRYCVNKVSSLNHPIFSGLVMYIVQQEIRKGPSLCIR